MNHNDSKGTYYSFGNTGIFKRVGNSTIRQHVNWLKHNVENQDEVEHVANDIEQNMAIELLGAVKSLSTAIPKIVLFIAPVLNIWYDF